MKCRHDRDLASVETKLSAESRDPSALSQEALERGGAKRHDDLGGDQLDLMVEVPGAGLHLFGPGFPVVRRTTLDDVHHVDFLPRKAHRRDHLVEQLPSLADER